MKESQKKVTFVVRIEYTQNHSWQGSVTWTDRNETQQFRSALELVHLMDNALAGSSTQSFCCAEDASLPSVQGNPT